jgi:hypothetical protein
MPGDVVLVVAPGHGYLREVPNADWVGFPDYAVTDSGGHD